MSRLSEKMSKGESRVEMDEFCMPRSTMTISLPWSLEQWRMLSGRWRERGGGGKHA